MTEILTLILRNIATSNASNLTSITHTTATIVCLFWNLNKLSTKSILATM